MERVDQREVVEYWLEREVSKTPGGVDPTTLRTEAAVGALLQHKPGAADVLWRDQPIRWYRGELSRSAFKRLHLVGGPSGVLWRALSPDGTVEGAAHRIATDPNTDLAAETGVDVDAIRAYRDRITADEDVGTLVVATRAGCAPTVVADGNHRATGRALHLLETGEYDPQRVYVAVGSNPILRPLRERLCGLVCRARARLPF